jgi:hypothetical protein
MSRSLVLRKSLAFCFIVLLLPSFLFGQAGGEIQKQRAATALEAQIEETRKQINALTQREASARNRRDATRSEAGGASIEVSLAERRHSEALAQLRANRESQIARRTVDIAQQDLDEARANHDNRETQARTAQEQWAFAETELRRERVVLEELQSRLRNLNSGAISPEDVLARIPARFIPALPELQTAQLDPDLLEEERRQAAERERQIIEEMERAQAAAAAAQQALDSIAAYEQEAVPVYDGDYFIFSIRPEFVVGPMENAISAAGGIGEIGIILANGLYLMGDLGGGAFYSGGSVNFAYCFNRNGIVKFAPGISTGFYHTKLKVEFTKDGNKIAAAEGRNTGIAGAFAKLMIGKHRNFDLTYKLLFGHNKVPVSYRASSDTVRWEEGLGARHSIGFGFALMKPRKEMTGNEN